MTYSPGEALGEAQPPLCSGTSRAGCALQQGGSGYQMVALRPSQGETGKELATQRRGKSYPAAHDCGAARCSFFR